VRKTIDTRVRPPFVVLFGPDGAGKTTQTRLLVSHLRSKGFRVRKIWIRNFHFPLAYVISRLLVSLGYYEVEPNPLRAKSTLNDTWGRAFSVKALPRMKPVWGFIEFVSVIPHILAGVVLPRALGYAVVAERYTIDTVVTVAEVLQDASYLNKMTARALVRMIPKDCILVYLRADYSEILKRRKDDAHGRRFIEFQLTAYDALCQKLNTCVIPTTNFTITETFQIITQLLDIHSLERWSGSNSGYFKIAE